MYNAVRNIPNDINGYNNAACQIVSIVIKCEPNNVLLDPFGQG